MRLTFCGAAKIVTGSCYLIEVGKDQFLVDCGMYQGSKEITRLNYQPFKFNPKKIKAVFLTHAHIDHSGLLPKLKKEGFKGPIFATPATTDLCKVMLEDSAHIQEYETEHENRRRQREGKPKREPLYNIKLAKATSRLFKKINYNKRYKITNNISIKYNDAGHILGSAIIELFVTENGKTKKIVFSGDLGQWNVPIIEDPTLIKDADYVLVESTYGDRLHDKILFRDQQLFNIIKETYRKGGKLLIPSFAVERTQEILYAINKMIKAGKFPKQKVFLDSPLAIKATEIFKKHKYLYDREAYTKYRNAFDFKQLSYSITVDDSKDIQHHKRPAIIIAGSGMCTAGRIRHHLKHGLWDPRNTVLIVGYQAAHTLGRVILEGAKHIRMMGMTIAVKAEVNSINSFSAHADYKELIKWMQGFSKRPKKVFIVHGEEKSANSLCKKLIKKGFNCKIPSLGYSVTI